MTLLVGENGSGKSTIVEALAVAFGLSPEGGSVQARHSTGPRSPAVGLDPAGALSPGASRCGFFLRAETMHGFYTYLEDNPGKRDPRFHEMSHGESFLEILRTRFLATGGAQVLCATHSPLLAALPGAQLLEVGPWGMRETTYDDLELVAHWRRYLDSPMRYLRHVLED